MKSTLKCIYSYYETLLGIWNSWNDGILYGKFPKGANNFTDALGIDTSDGRSRAKELYRIGLLKKELTKGTIGLNFISEGNNIQSDLGYISAIISKASIINRTYKIDKALSALCAIYSIIQSIKIDDYEFSLNTLVQRFEDVYPCPKNIDFRKWHRYILSAFFCEIKYRNDTHLSREEQENDSLIFHNFFNNQGECPSMTIRTNEKKGYTVRKEIKSIKDIHDAIVNKVSLTDIIQQKLPLFIFGDEKDTNPKGFYGMAIKYNASFLTMCYKNEIRNIENSPFSVFYDEDSNESSKGNILNKLIIIFSNQDINLKNEFSIIMKTIYEGAIDALNILNYNQKTYKSNPQEVNQYTKYITAIKSKPFLLLAGISGTGKSRIVRELARACWEEGTEEYMAQKPSNFEMVQVKPNWHNSNELIGFVSRVSGEAKYIAGDFLKFVARAWMNPAVPYFLCLDEMNLAPVEQYFAEFLSVIESRKSKEDGNITTDPILKKTTDDWYRVLTDELTEDNEEVRNRFLEEGICIPQNLIVVGTVNMDETTYSFSRKVLDRAMSIEMNEVDLYGGLTSRHESIGKLEYEDLIGNAVEGMDVYLDNKEVCDVALDYLSKVNEVLNGTSFKIAYRTRNEFLLYVVNNLPYNKDKEDNELSQGYVIARALDEITSMKILSRIEGDDSKVRESLLNNLNNVIETELNSISGNEYVLNSISLAKLKEMKEKLAYGYTSFWS